MSFVRSSKFRHVYGTPAKPEKCYTGFTISKNMFDSNMSSVNEKFLAVVLEQGGGGAFIIIPLSNVGRFDGKQPKVEGHKAPVVDLAWNPFDDNQIASSSEDCTVMIWNIPDGGLKENITKPLVTLVGHQKKVGQILWHPSASNVLASSSNNEIIIFNTETSEEVTHITCPDVVYCMSWSYNGSLLATTCKDKKVRVIDPRTGEVVSEGSGHTGSKPSRIVFCGHTNRLFTSGFTRMSERQYALWDPNNLGQPLTIEKIDSGSGVLFPFWDEGTNVVYLIGKGGTKITFFEVNDKPPYVHYLSLHQVASPYRAAACMPKRHLDYMHCEIMRFFGLTNKNIVEPLSMTVPRKSEMFQEDIYPPCPSGEAAMTASEWASGVDKDPNLVAFSAKGLNKTVNRPDFKSTVRVSAPSPKAVSTVAATVSSTSLSKPVCVAVGRQSSGQSVSSRESTPPATLPEPKTLEEYRKAYRALVRDNFNLPKSTHIKWKNLLAVRTVPSTSMYRKAYKELEEENKRLRALLGQ